MSVIEIGKPKAFKPDHIRVSGDSIFYTIQGEGVTAGIPSLFLRLHECNLQCSWCDAWYTWKRDTKEYQTESEDIQIETLAQLMWNAMVEHECNHWVITGGEPMMQMKQVSLLITNILNRFGPQPQGKIYFEIETNGTIKPDSYLTTCSRAGLVQFNVSPKTQGSGNGMYRAIKAEVLKEYTGMNAWFKFVVGDIVDVTDIIQVVEMGSIPKKRIMLMPLGTTTEELAGRYSLCASIAMQYNWRVVPRMQIHMFGNRRAT